MIVIMIVTVIGVIVATVRMSGLVVEVRQLPVSPGLQVLIRFAQQPSLLLGLRRVGFRGISATALAQCETYGCVYR